MLEMYRDPLVYRVAVVAIDGELTPFGVLDGKLAVVRVGVTGHAGGVQRFVVALRMAFGTFHVDMRPFQFEAGPLVLEKGRFPRRFTVARDAVLRELALVLVAVAIAAFGKGNAFELVQQVAFLAFDFLVRPLQREISPLVVKAVGSLLPAVNHMAFFAVQAQ